MIGPAPSMTFRQDEPTKNKLLMGIWAIAPRESFREVANRFGFKYRMNI